MSDTEISEKELTLTDKKRLAEYKKDPLEDKAMESKIQMLAKILEAKKGENIQILDLRKIHSYLSFFMIVTGNSVLHSKGLLKEIRRNLKDLEIEKYMYLDDRSADWIVIDCLWLVIHIFTARTRDFFALEKLWADARRIEWE